MFVMNLAPDMCAKTANNGQYIVMYGIKKIMLKTFLVLLWGFAANALQCLECQDMPSPEDCRIVSTCSSNSQCFVDQVVTSGGSILYNTGCRSTSSCENIGRIPRGTVSESDIVTCVSCCEDDFCNIGGCGVVAKRQPQRPPLCFSCQSQVDPNSCRDVTLCDQEQMCALIETAMYNSHQWKSECAPRLLCQTLGSIAVGNGHCAKCCQDDFCNNNCNQEITKTTPAFTTTSSQSPSVTFLTPTKFSTSTLSATVLNSNPSKQTHNIEVTTMNAFTGNKSTTTSHTSTQKLMVTSTIATYSNATTEIIPSATSAHTYSSSSLSKPPASTLNNIHVSTSPSTLVSKQMPATTQSTSSGTSTATISSKETTTTLETFNTTLTPNMSGSCINRTFDICFVIDTSGFLGQIEFEKELHFVSEVVRNIAMKTNSTTHFCAVQFSTDAALVVNIRKFHSVDSIINSIRTIPYSPGETNTHIGLQKAVHDLHRFGRPDVEKEIILVTSGKSNIPDQTLHVVRHMDSVGIGLYAVGIGSQTNSSELQALVTDNNHLLEVPDPDHLENLYINIVQALCRGRNETVTNNLVQSLTTTVSPTTKPMNETTSLTTETWNFTKSVNSVATTSLASSASSETRTTKSNMNDSSLNPKLDSVTTAKSGATGTEQLHTLPANIPKNVTDITVNLQTSTTTHYPASKQTNQNTFLTTESSNYTKSVNSTVAAHLTSSANIGPETTTNIFNVTSVDHHGTEATDYTGSKHSFTIPANSSQNVNFTDVSQQTLSATMSQATTQTIEITSFTAVSLNRTKGVNSTVATGLTSPATNGTEITMNNMNVTSVDPISHVLTTVTTGVSGYTISTNSMSLNQTGSVLSTSATTLTSPASNRTGTTKNNMNVTSVDPTTTTTTTTTGVTGKRHPVTRPANSISCAVCSGPEFLCEKLYATQQCDPPNNYCINKLHNHIDGSRIVTRQCGNFETCYRDWYLGSSDSDKCRKFDGKSILTLDFSCTYCCINDNCNEPIRPSRASLYVDE